VHPDVLETDVPLDESELLLPIGAQPLVGPAGADAPLEDLAVRSTNG
jgi:hypothetical protein